MTWIPFFVRKSNKDAVNLCFLESLPMAMQSGEIRKLPAASSPMFVSQWAYQGSAKAPYIVSRKGGYKGTGYAT